jgi:hypothetical protein
MTDVPIMILVKDRTAAILSLSTSLMKKRKFCPFLKMKELIMSAAPIIHPAVL